MEIQSNFSLKKYNTFGIEASAKQFVAVHSIAELKTILSANKNEKKFILGGGSNMLLTKDIDALVIHIDLKGKKSQKRTMTLFGLKVRQEKLGTILFFGQLTTILAV